MATQDISQLVVEVKSTGIQTAAKQLDNLATSADKAEQAVKKLGTSVVGVNGMMTGGVAQATALITAITSLTAVINQMSQSQTRATATTRANNDAMAEAHALARGLSGTLGALWVTYGNLAGMGIGIAIGASLKGIVSVGKDVEQTLEQIRVLGGASVEDVAKMSAAISDLGKGAQGPRDVAEALNVLTLAGLNAKQAMQGVGAALSLSIAGGVSVEKSAETLVQVGTALGYSADAYDHVGDVIAKTAAASMSSVDSISNAFKSAAAVGEVYGATLQDIALGLAAVANLGIQGTSAGTALKNFYKDLSASTQKVTQALKDMHLNISDFRDAQGFMLPLIDVVKKLDSGFNSLNQQQKKLAEVKMFSQQGVREFAVLSSMLHTASDQVDEFGKKYANKLEEVAGEISKSAAFATLSAIAMGQTTSNQLKSVGNTIQSVFSEVFADVQPQIGSVARSLKAAFNSGEFKAGLKEIATNVADLTKYLVDHIGVIKNLALAYAGMKVFEFAKGLGAVALAFDVASVSAKGFWTSLGPIGIAIAGLTYLWGVYKTAKDKALDNKPAEDNLQEYADRVREAAAKELAVLEMKKKGYSDAAIAREQEMQAQEDASARAVNTVKAGVEAMKKAKEAMWAGMSEQERKTANLVIANPGTRDQILAGGGSAVADYVKQNLLYNEALAKANKLIKETELNTLTLNRARKQSAEIDDKAAKDNRFLSTGTGMLTGKPDIKGANDAYNEAITKFQNDIKMASKGLSEFREQEDAKFKAGQIGKLQLIDKVADKEVATYKRIAEDAAAQKKIAEATPNKKADAERFQGEIDRANESIEQAEKMRRANTLAAEREMQTQITNLKIKALEDQGKFVEAASLKWSAESKTGWMQAASDASATGNAVAKEYLAAQDAIKLAAMQSAQLKEDSVAFDTALLDVQGTLKGLKDGAYGSSVSDIFDNATKATKKFETAMGVLRAKTMNLFLDAQTSNTPEAWKKYAEASKALGAEADSAKTKWLEAADAISKALSDAFGAPGKALGDLSKASMEYQNTENASAETRMKQYGDMTQAASGFFDKQSRGFKLLNGISQVFHVAEMARISVRTAANIYEAASKFFAQLGMGGWAGIAAMGATMAALGYAVTGGGNGSDPKLSSDYVQKHQGTGTVLGDADAKSESISKALDDLKNNSDMMLPLTQNMLTSLQGIEAAMTGLSNLVARSGVSVGSNFDLGLKSSGSGFLGALFGKSSTTLKDSGLSFGGSVADLMLGKGFNQYAVTNTSSSSLFGLIKSSKDSSMTQALSAEMSNQFALVFQGLDATLKSAATTLGSNSDAVGTAIQNMVLESTKVSLKDLKGQDLTDAINNVISGAMDEIAKKVYPQMTAFQKVGEGYAETVVRVAGGIEQADAALKKLNVSAVSYLDIANKTGDISYEIAKQSIALKEGASGVGEIMTQITGTMSDVISAYTDLVAARKKMQDTGLGGGLNMATLQGAGDLKSLTSDLSSFYDKYFTAAQKVAIETSNMTAQFTAIGYTLPNTRDELKSWITAAASAGDQLKVGQLLALASGFDTLKTSIDDLAKSTDMFSSDAVDAAKTAFDNAVSVAETAYSRLETSINAEKTKIQSSVDSINNVLSTLADALKATAPKDTQINSFKKALAVINQAIATVGSGGDISKVAGLDDAIKTVSSQSTDAYSTAFEYQRAQAEANAALMSLQRAGQSQVSIYQKQLDTLDQQLDTARQQLDALKGIDNSVLTVAAALANFAGAMSEATTAKNNYAAVQAGNTGGVSAAVESLYKNVLGRASDEAGKAFWMNALSSGSATMAQVTQAFYDSAEYKATSKLPSFDVGTNNVPEDMLAMVHKGERIIPAADNAELQRKLDKVDSDKASSGESSVATKLDQLMDVIVRGDVANVQKMNEMVKIVKQWDGYGMPPERPST
jgi:TP901 family phage tail tape measure protein